MSNCNKFKQPCATPWQCSDRCRLVLNQDNSDASCPDSEARKTWPFWGKWLTIVCICYFFFFLAGIVAGSCS